MSTRSRWCENPRCGDFSGGGGATGERKMERGMQQISRNGMVILMCVGTTMLFTVLMVLDRENNFACQGFARRGTKHAASDRAPLNRWKDATHDPQCLARTQHLLYRRDPGRFAPSPAFTRAMDRYAAMHVKCAQGKDWSHEFLHARGEADECQYLIVMEGSGGTGNKLLSLTSAFAFGLATDRVVLVEGGNKFQALLCDPFPGTSWFLPAEFPYQNVIQADGLNVAIAKNFIDVSMVMLRLDHVQSHADTQFFCDHTHAGLAKVRWVGWSSNQYYLTRLMMVPSLWARLHPLAPSVDLFTLLSHRLLLPKNELWAHIVRVFLGYLAGASKSVGVQVRSHGRSNLAEFDPLVFDRIVDCLQTREVLPKLAVAEDMSDMMAFAEDGGEDSGSISVLLTSLQLRYYDELKDLYAENPNANNTVTRFHMVSHLGGQDRSAHQGEMAFVEMWLLSFTDVLVISAYSTFGYIPQGIGGVKALSLNIRGEMVPNMTSCYEGYSTQPCTHFPQKLKCEPGAGDATEAHSEWMRHHVRECVDQPGGLQLVNQVEQPNPSVTLWEL